MSITSHLLCGELLLFIRTMDFISKKPNVVLHTFYLLTLKKIRKFSVLDDIWAVNV